MARLVARLGKLGKLLRDVGAGVTPPAIQFGFLELDSLRKSVPVGLAREAAAQGLLHAAQYLRRDCDAADGVARA